MTTRKQEQLYTYSNTALTHFDGLMGEGFVVFPGAGEQEAVGDGGMAGGLVAVHGGDDVGATKPVGFREVGGADHMRGVVRVRVVEANDVEAGVAGFALGFDELDAERCGSGCGRCPCGCCRRG